MRIDFLGLHAFLAIAERGSFQQAAAHLNLSQTALSHRMRKLENDLGVRLLARTTREVALTPAGLQLLPEVKASIEGLAAAIERLRGGGRARHERIAIGCLPTIAAGRLPAVLTRFQAIHPGVIVEVRDNSAADIARHVADGAVEFAITFVAAQRWDFEVELLAREDFVLVCRADHAFASRSAASWSEIETVPLIRISQHTGNRMMIDDALGSRRERLSWRYEVQHVASAIALVRAGLGMTVVPALALDTLDRGDLATLRLKNPSVTRQIGIVSRRAAPLSPLAEDLRRLVRAEFAASPKGDGAEESGEVSARPPPGRRGSGPRSTVRDEAVADGGRQGAGE